MKFKEHTIDEQNQLIREAMRIFNNTKRATANVNGFYFLKQNISLTTDEYTVLVYEPDFTYVDEFKVAEEVDYTEDI